MERFVMHVNLSNPRLGPFWHVGPSSETSNQVVTGKERVPSSMEAAALLLCFPPHVNGHGRRAVSRKLLNSLCYFSALPTALPHQEPFPTMQSSSEPVSLGQSLLSAMGEHNESGGTGSRFGRIVIILAGVSALIATSFTCL